MLRFIVYRYTSYKDSKISHASLLTLRHHLSQLPPALHRPHSPTTCTRPTHDLPLYSAIYPRSAYPTYVHTTPYPLLRYHLLHILSRTHVPHSTPPCPSPPQMYHAPLYPIASTTQPYLSLLYLPFSSATFIGLIRPIAPIPTRARTGQVVGVIGLIGAIGLIPP